jgi:hypothetical protein
MQKVVMPATVTTQVYSSSRAIMYGMSGKNVIVAPIEGLCVSTEETSCYKKQEDVGSSSVNQTMLFLLQTTSQ